MPVILPDYLQPGLRIVFVGTAVGTKSAERGHYYAGPGNEFWRFLHVAELTPRLLAPDEDATLPSYGIGLTDLAKHIAQSHDRGLTFDLPAFTAKIQQYQPVVVAFTSKQAATVYARHLGERVASYGAAVWTVAGRAAYVLPSPSAANRTPTNPPRVAWWRSLAHFAHDTVRGLIVE
ncbi:MAG TPA: mismatch-specific DNA-glycosylase [Jatrophihabitantaceae bacterium]|jgi:TDG/mug DNA glycosylase family protein